MSGRRRTARKATAAAAPRDRAPSASRTGSPRRWLILVGAFAAVILLAATSAFLILSWRSGPAEPPRAAIVDQLGLTFPNPGFTEKTTSVLEQAGYTVDYYPGEEVTVDFYRDLPTHGYDLLILRVHSARRPDVLRSKLPDEASLFTSEAYSRSSHVDEQNDLRLVKVSYEGADEVFFGLRSDFITSSMKGRFDGATIVLMGCNGLTTTRTADAFIQRGADAVVGWSDLVSASHTDRAVEHLIEKVTLDGLPMAEAVAHTMEDVGPDPAFESELVLYPPEG